MRTIEGNIGTIAATGTTPHTAIHCWFFLVVPNGCFGIRILSLLVVPTLTAGKCASTYLLKKILRFGASRIVIHAEERSHWFDSGGDRVRRGAFIGTHRSDVMHTEG